MKVWIYRSSGRGVTDGEKREFESLEDCIKTLMKETEEIGPEYIVTEVNEHYWNEKFKDCQWTVEIYDYWRE